jgi:quinol monooxygenase YgiN
MRALMARYRADPEHGDAIETALRAMAEAVARDEPACLTYRAARSTEDTGSFVLYEEYLDEAALLAHRETPHFRELIEGVVVPLLTSREREIFVPITGGAGGGDGA